MKTFNNYSVSRPTPLPLMKHVTSLASEPLTSSELAQLKQKTNEKIVLLQKIFPDLKVVSAR